MFSSEGIFPVTIKQAAMADSQFANDSNAFDICLLVETEDGQSDWWRTECSQRYIQAGMFKGMTEIQASVEKLDKLGLPNRDLNLYEQLIGVKTQATTKASKPHPQTGKVFFNVRYLGSSSKAPEQLHQNEMQRRMQLMTQPVQNPSFQQPQQQQPAQQGAFNPAQQPAQQGAFNPAQQPAHTQ